MPKGDSLGEFEQLVLLAVLRLGDDAYGMKVRQEISARTGRDVTIGAVYTTLERLETKRLVRSELAGPTPERGGRAKRSFHVTAPGMEALNRARQNFESMMEGLFPLPGDARLHRLDSPSPCSTQSFPHAKPNAWRATCTKSFRNSASRLHPLRPATGTSARYSGRRSPSPRPGSNLYS